MRQGLNAQLRIPHNESVSLKLALQVGLPIDFPESSPHLFELVDGLRAKRHSPFQHVAQPSGLSFVQLQDPLDLVVDTELTAEQLQSGFSVSDEFRV